MRSLNFSIFLLVSFLLCFVFYFLIFTHFRKNAPHPTLHGKIPSWSIVSLKRTIFRGEKNSIKKDSRKSGASHCRLLVPWITSVLFYFYLLLFTVSFTETFFFLVALIIFPRSQSLCRPPSVPVPVGRKDATDWRCLHILTNYCPLPPSSSSSWCFSPTPSTNLFLTSASFLRSFFRVRIFQSVNITHGFQVQWHFQKIVVFFLSCCCS